MFMEENSGILLEGVMSWLDLEITENNGKKEEPSESLS